MASSTDPYFGVVVRRDSSENVAAYAADLSIIGLVGPADDADASVFPLNFPVRFFSNDPVMTKAIGAAGFIRDAVSGINDQLAPAQRAAVIVFVRTASGTNADPALKNQETIRNIVGSSLDLTGIWALTRAPEECNCTPRLVSTPGFTGLLANGVDHLAIGTLGKGYVPGQRYELTFSGGGTAPVQGHGYAIADEAGNIGQNNLVVESSGAWYTAAPTVTVGGVAPTGAGSAVLTVTAVIDQLANPICAALPAVLNQLLGHAVVESAGTSVTSSQAWRETLNSERLIPVHGGVKVQDPVTGAIVVRPLAPRVLGVAVRRDYEKGAPFHSWANQPIYGIVGPAQSLSFSIASGANEGQTLLGSNIGIVAKGEVGNDFAIADGGFIFIGTDTSGDDPDWREYHVTRGRDYLNLLAVRTLRSFLGRRNINPQTVEALVISLRLQLRDLKSDGHILGGSCNFYAADNGRSNILLGRITLRFRAEEAPVLKRVTLMSGRDHTVLDTIVQDLQNSLFLAT